MPNLPAQVGRVLKMAIVPFVTIGARNTLGAFDRAGQKALSAVTRRRLLGGGITDPAGVYYSPKMLDDLAEDYGLGVSTLETERVGSLARDLQKQAEREGAGFGVWRRRPPWTCWTPSPGASSCGRRSPWS